MPAKLGIVCAFNPGNSGMFSVDLAADQVMRRLNLDYDLLKFQKRPWRFSHRFKTTRNLKHLSRYSHIIYWGDFQNNPLYGGRDFSRREIKFKYAENSEQAFNNWKMLHLELHEYLPSKIVWASVGNCFLGSGAALQSEDMRDAMQGFVTKAVQILPRERQSATELISLLGKKPCHCIKVGLDAAFLIDPPQNSQRESEQCFGYFFKRSKVIDVERTLNYVAQFTGLTPMQIGWQTGARSALDGLLYSRAIAKLRACKFIITDVYHLTVNALNYGVPTICVSRQNDATQGTLGDQKKYALLEQLGAERFHLTLPKNGSLWSIREDIKGVHDNFVRSDGEFGFVRESLKQQKNDFLKSIMELVK